MDLGIYVGQTEGAWGVSTLVENPVTGSPYFRMFYELRDAIAYARDRVARGPGLYYPRSPGQARPERNPSARVYYVGIVSEGEDDPEEREFAPQYRVLRGHMKGTDSTLVFRNAGVVTLRGQDAIRWKLDRTLSIIGHMYGIQTRIRKPRRSWSC